jgi:vacuolar-type H+-ATPase subunit H
MSEVEYKGIKFKGAKLLLLFPLLGTLGGILWGGFEFYKDYMDMKEQIQSYVAPDLSGFENRLSVFEEKTNALEILLNEKITNMEVLLTTELDKATQLVQSAQEDARSIRTDMRKDLTEIQDSISAVDKRSRNMNTEVREALRTAETDIRSLIDHANDRFDSKRTAIESDGQRRIEIIDTKLEALEKKITDMLQRALNNPLTGQ